VLRSDLAAINDRPSCLAHSTFQTDPLPGDVIACGTSLGVGSVKLPENTIEVTIDGIGTLSNLFEQ
jgi:2-keto-4-pentenoate hydratase/2-oxohepta-3-ene-1,7-dioic acid hydratase in catechol pathway